MANNNAVTIKDILSTDTYIIPRYQRNYAWGQTEISQLIKDIDEFFDINENKSYYLGSLVCFKRENGKYELLDGQQRHTTITLINLVLRNLPNINDTVSLPNIEFDSRKRCQDYICNLYQSKENFNKSVKELNNIGVGNFKDAIEIIQEELNKEKENIDGTKSRIDINKFAYNFYNNVFLFRIQVPEDTDLNHYFEIMNNRGEQLEKHEIVKALLMGQIKCDDDQRKEEDQRKFATIWDACSDMSDYVYFNFDSTIRQYIFDDNGNLRIDNFDCITISKIEETQKDQLLWDILNDPFDLPTGFPNEEKTTKEKYKSIIDFPNFLLQVLKLEDESVSLDDKKLLDQFNQLKPNPQKFIFNLLKYRTLFDKYVVKQDLADADDSKRNWGIRSLDSSFDGIIKTYDPKIINNDDEGLVKIQVMLYYSDSTNTYNNWLQVILKNQYFYNDNREDLAYYYSKVFEIAKKKFNRDNLSYPDISIFNLYFIDFLLWRLYDSNVKNKTILKPVKDQSTNYKLNVLMWKMSEKKDLFNTFKFRQISSREHLLSQEHGKRYDIAEEIYNGIGNLCLISTSQNSAGNKENPIDKRKMFIKDNTSLKRIIMFESFDEATDTWRAEQIQKHKEMIDILINYEFINYENR